MNHLIRLRTTTPLFLIVLLLACSALPQSAQAVSPAPDGGYLNFNTAEGDNALFSLTGGVGNTASGAFALNSSSTGNFNTANGLNALLNNTTGSVNTANDVNALLGNTIGTDNTANGTSALNHNTTGSNNTALGFLAGQNLTTGGNNIDIGANVLGVAGESNAIRIGRVGTQTKAFIAGIHGATASGGAAVFVNSAGQLGTAPSSKRFKDKIKLMNKASEAILALKPVSFHYKKDIDPDGTPQFGLVAEEVEKVNPALITRDADGKPYTVRYDQVNAMLLNEFLKEAPQSSAIGSERRRAAKGNQRSRGNGERAGRANSKK